MSAEDFDKSIIESIRENSTRDDFNDMYCDRCSASPDWGDELKYDGTWKLCEACLDEIFEDEAK